MQNPPQAAMQVSNLSATLAFLTETLGFTLLEERPDEDFAYMCDSDGDSWMVAGPGVQDIPSYLSAPKFVAKPGESLAFGNRDLDTWQAELSRKGVPDIEVSQRQLGDRVLSVKGPDNYTFQFIQAAEHSFEELLSLYARSSDDVDEALRGLSDDDMSLALSDNTWNIRQIVHHICDTDILFGEHMKVALSASGATMESHTPVGNERISVQPEYRERPVASSLAFSRAFHAYILDIVKYIPDAGEHFIEDNNGRKHTFNQFLHLSVGHTGEHIEEIQKIRRKYGK
ncbi:MAG TPA: DinB family protein [Ktedonobacteraceae bacterium]|nr:DinB family protein [Ktedonobacteraceae bacterium]